MSSVYPRVPGVAHKRRARVVIFEVYGTGRATVSLTPREQDGCCAGGTGEETQRGRERRRPHRVGIRRLLVPANIFNARYGVLLPALVQQPCHHVVIEQRELVHVPGRADVHHPTHAPLSDLASDAGRALLQLCPELADLLDGLAGMLRDAAFDLLADDVGKFGTATIGGDHDLKRPAADLRAEIEVAGGRDVGNVDGDLAFATECTYLTGDLDVVNCRQDHVNTLKVLGPGEDAIMIGDAVAGVDELLRERVEACAGGNEGDARVGDEDGLDATRGDVAAADDEDGPVLELPGKEEGASGERRDVWSHVMNLE